MDDDLTLTIIPWSGPHRTVTDSPEVIGFTGHDAVDDRTIRSAYVDHDGQRHWFKRDGLFNCQTTTIR